MTELGLLDALVAFLTGVFRDYQLPAKRNLLQNVKVFAQYLPQPEAPEVETSNEDEISDEETDNEAETEESEDTTKPLGYSADDIENNFPCIIVKLEECTTREERTIDAVRINVNLLIGVYDESSDCQGYRDVMNVIEKAKQEILEMPSRILAHRYRLVMPMKDYLFAEQAWPIYFGQIETVWETGRPLTPNNPRCEIRF